MVGIVARWGCVLPGKWGSDGLGVGYGGVMSQVWV